MFNYLCNTGVGEMQTYLLTKRKTAGPKTGSSDKSGELTSYCSDLSVGSGELWDEEDEYGLLDLPSVKVAGEINKDQRLIDWQVESLLGLLKKIVAFRHQGKKKKAESFKLKLEKGETVLDEVKEIIAMPVFDAKKSTISSADLDSVQISRAVEAQLRKFVEMVASTYHENPFHNFEHAVSHYQVAAGIAFV